MNRGIPQVENVLLGDPEYIYFNPTTKIDLKIGFRIENKCKSSQISGSENPNHRIAPRDAKITQFRKHHSMRNDEKYLHPNFGEVWSTTDFSRNLGDPSWRVFKKICYIVNLALKTMNKARSQPIQSPSQWLWTG